MATKKDFYDVLDVERGADDAVIKKAFRKLALKYHPDRNPGDAAAEARFREISEAYQVLSDVEQRARYDQFGHAAFDQQGAGGFGQAGFEEFFGDIFNDFFGGGGRGRRRRGEDLSYTLEVSFEEAAFGCTKKIPIPRAVSCGDCGGQGGKDGSPPERCADCRGLGQVRFQQGFFSISKTCGKCNGRGEIVRDPRTTCRGSGNVREEQELEVRVPGGVDTGTRLALRGEGEVGANGNRGDLFVLISVDDHEHFRREGNHVLCQVEVGFAQAVLGTEIQVPTLDGPVSMTIKSGTQPGTLFRMRGKGIPDVKGYGRGDQLTRINVTIPRQITPRQRELLEEFAAIGGEDIDPESKGFFDKVREKFG